MAASESSRRDSVGLPVCHSVSDAAATLMITDKPENLACRPPARRRNSVELQVSDLTVTVTVIQVKELEPLLS